jgi:hypothetical protein
VRSAKTVNAKVTSQTLTSIFVSFSSSRISPQSPTLYDTTSRIAASTDSGMNRASGAATSSTASSVSAWTMPDTGVCAPDRMFVAVRAIAPVAGRPPNNGDATLAIPCATSSTFGLWRSPPIRSATTADISDSSAPSIATVSAGWKSTPTSSSLNRGSVRVGHPAGMPPNFVPMVSTGSRNKATMAVPASRATM